MTIKEKQEFIRFVCIHCDAILKTIESKLLNKTKCPKCSEILVPQNCLVKNKEEVSKDLVIKVPQEKTKSSYFGKSVLFLLLIILMGSSYFLYRPTIQPDLKLLRPKISLPENQTVFKKLSLENQKVLESVVLNPDKELPFEELLPELTPEQDRPSRFLIDSALIEAAKILESDATVKLSFMQQIDILELAYRGNPSPKYLEFFLKKVNSKEPITLEEAIKVLKMIKNQKAIVSELETALTISFYAKAFDQIKTQASQAKAPVLAAQIFYSTLLLPIAMDKSEVIDKIKPILEASFQHKNSTRDDGLFLSEEESTQFSLQLIQSIWQYHLDHNQIPNWLLPLAEKEACRLAYRLEADGCLPDWTGENKRENLTGDIYKAAVVFDRDDLRYIAFGGRRMANAYAPKQKDFDFKEIGIYIIRSHWDHNPSTAIDSFRSQEDHSNAFQITYNIELNKVSISLGALTHLTFYCKSIINDFEKFKTSFDMQPGLPPMANENSITIEKIDLALAACSKHYLILNETNMISSKTSWGTSYFTELKSTYNIQILQNEFNKINKIQFIKRNQ